MPVSTVTPVREGFHTITPFIAVPNAPELIDFLKRTFGAQETSRHPHGEGFIASVKVDDTDLLIMGNPGLPGQERIGAFHVYVPDCDATYNRALEAGATSLGAPSDHSYGERAGYVKDAAGNQWYIATHLGATPALENLWNVTPFAHPSSVRKYIDFLTTVMGAKELAVHEHGGKVMYAAAQIGDAVLEMGESPNPLPSGFYLFVEDCDAVYHRAIKAGATSLWPPADQHTATALRASSIRSATSGSRPRTSRTWRRKPLRSRQAIQHVTAKGWPGSMRGCSKSSEYRIPSFSITRRERVLPGTVKETISGKFRLSNPYANAARAPSVAKPCPHQGRASRHPISTHGVKDVSKAGTAKPMNPMNGA